MPWQVPNIERDHGNRKFAFDKKSLHLLHVVHGKTPREIAELHERLAGYTIGPQGVAGYLRAYGLYRPRKPGSSQRKKLRQVGGNGSLYYYHPAHPAANRQGRVLVGRLIAERKYGPLDFREWRIVYGEGRLNPTFENVTVVPTRRKKAADLLQEARERRLEKDEVAYIRQVARRERLCIAALVFRLQLELRSRTQLKSVGSSHMIRLLETHYPWFVKCCRSREKLCTVLAKSQRISVDAFRRFRLKLDRKIPVRYLRWEEKFGFIPLQFILKEPVPDKYIR